MPLWHVAKVTETRDGCVFRTKIIASFWKNVDAEKRTDAEIAQSYGGDMLVSTKDSVIAKRAPE